ncbi:MAG: hypothetical protein DMG36_24410 [Acidobacteria bacterium]|nr:MAG: hypothetical protein DMG36_24410 [Acidobacteriota bacterium]
MAVGLQRCNFAAVLVHASVEPPLGGIGQGRGEPSAVSVEPPPGGIGQGRGDPSATTGLLTLNLPLLNPGSKIKAARNKTANRTANFFMDEPSWLFTVRARGVTRGQISKMF